ARAYKDVFTASLRSACFHRYGHFVINLTPPKRGFAESMELTGKPLSFDEKRRGQSFLSTIYHINKNPAEAGSCGMNGVDR
ncbi:hypothetical protein ACTK80_004452, partial [Yersinia enterocolitica]